MLNISNLGQLVWLLDEVQKEWYQLGLQLKLQPHILDVIRKDFHSTKECCTEMLKLWLQMVDPQPSWEKLLQALEHVGCRHLALKLSKDHNISFPGMYEVSNSFLGEPAVMDFAGVDKWEVESSSSGKSSYDVKLNNLMIWLCAPKLDVFYSPVLAIAYSCKCVISLHSIKYPRGCSERHGCVGGAV